MPYALPTRPRPTPRAVSAAIAAPGSNVVPLFGPDGPPHKKPPAAESDETLQEEFMRIASECIALAKAGYRLGPVSR